MKLAHLAEQIEGSPVGQLIRESTWLFPAIEIVHLISLTVLGGAVFALTLSVLGVGLKTPPADIEKTTRPFLAWAIIGLLVTGVLLGVSEPVKLLDRQSFLVKMIGLAIALPFTYFVFNPLVRRNGAGLAARGSALILIALWLTVAIAGRWIGFS